MTDQLYNKISSEMDSFTKILTYIPGFKGYFERQNRREADKILRETVAKRMEEQWSRVSALQRDFISQGAIQYLDELEAAAIKLRTFADRIRHARQGYSGVFDAIKIQQDELARLYEYDAAMLGLTDDVGRAVDNVEASIGSDGLPAALRNLIHTAQRGIDIFDRREEVMLTSPEPPQSLPPAPPQDALPDPNRNPDAPQLPKP